MDPHVSAHSTGQVYQAQSNNTGSTGSTQTSPGEMHTQDVAHDHHLTPDDVKTPSLHTGDASSSSMTTADKAKEQQPTEKTLKQMLGSVFSAVKEGVSKFASTSSKAIRDTARDVKHEIQGGYFLDNRKAELQAVKQGISDGATSLKNHAEDLAGRVGLIKQKRPENDNDRKLAAAKADHAQLTASDKQIDKQIKDLKQNLARYPENSTDPMKAAMQIQVKKFIEQKIDNTRTLEGQRSAINKMGDTQKADNAAFREQNPTLKDKVFALAERIESSTSSAFEAIKDLKHKENREALKEAAGDKLSDLKETVGTKLGEFKDTAGTKLGELKETVGTKLGELKETVGTKLGEFKDTAGAKLGELKDAAKEKLGMDPKDPTVKFDLKKNEEHIIEPQNEAKTHIADDRPAFEKRTRSSGQHLPGQTAYTKNESPESKDSTVIPERDAQEIRGENKAKLSNMLDKLEDKFEGHSSGVKLEVDADIMGMTNKVDVPIFTYPDGKQVKYKVDINVKDQSIVFKPEIGNKTLYAIPFDEHVNSNLEAFFNAHMESTPDELSTKLKQFNPNAPKEEVKAKTEAAAEAVQNDPLQGKETLTEAKDTKENTPQVSKSKSDGVLKGRAAHSAPSKEAANGANNRIARAISNPLRSLARKGAEKAEKSGGPEGTNTAKTMNQKAEQFFQLRDSLKQVADNKDKHLIFKNGEFKLVKNGKPELREAAVREAASLLIDLHRNLGKDELNTAVKQVKESGKYPDVKLTNMVESDVINAQLHVANLSKDVLAGNVELSTALGGYFAETTYGGPIKAGQQLLEIRDRQQVGLKKMFDRFKQPGTIDPNTKKQRPDRIMNFDKEKFEWGTHVEGLNVMNELATNFEKWKSEGFPPDKQPTKGGANSVNNFKGIVYEVCGLVNGEIKGLQVPENATEQEQKALQNLKDEAATRMADLKSMLRGSAGMNAKPLDFPALEGHIEWFAANLPPKAAEQETHETEHEDKKT